MTPIGPQDAGAPGSSNFALFDTPVGECAVVWTARGIRGFSLPGATLARTREHVLRRHSAAVETDRANWPSSVDEAMREVLALLSGQRRDLLGIVLDLDAVPPFHRRVYELTRRIAPGQIRFYGEIARELGDAGASRAVGQALGQNPIAVIVPCHRVMAAGGRPGGFSAPGGLVTKFRLLSIEGAQVVGGSTLFDAS